jgi:hypothetical protein
MLQLDFPAFDCKVKQADGKLYILDVLRKKYIFLTPEEWVRQHLIHFLLNHRSYPHSLMQPEAGLKYNQLAKRADLLVYTASGKPFLLAECKGANIELCELTFEQASQYNYIVKAPYLLLTNGLEHFCYAIDFEKQQAERLADIPFFSV